MIAQRDFEKNTENMRRTRDLLHTKIKEKITNIKFNGNSEHNLPNTLSLSFHNAKANEIVLKLSPHVCISGSCLVSFSYN